ncbi:MAG: cupredoxin domain-containing protein [Nitrosarchaeum sp.]
MNTTIVVLLVLLALSGFTFSNSFAIISPNSAFTLEGSGYAVTNDTIKISEIDLALSTQKQIGSNVKSTIEDVLITLDDKSFLATELNATTLREGNYIRINGIVKSNTGDNASIKLFGRLVEESKNASVYGFSGRIMIDDIDYKIIYTAKLSELSKIKITPTKSKTDEKLVIHILKGSSTQGVGTYIDLGQIRQQAIKTQSSTDSLRFRYFSQDRISIEPGTTITIVNDDVVSHSVLSGKENRDRYNQFTADGRISTGKILPDQSINITLDEAGFYRLYDPDYQWMKIVVYVFPNIETSNVILGQGKNLGN